MKQTLKLNKYFLIDCIRFYLALVFIVYAKNKLMHDQFIVHPYWLDQKLADVSPHALSWYAFGFEPFNYTVAIVQIILSILLIFKRTVFIGAIGYLFMLITILLIDITYLEGWTAMAIISKVVFMIALNLILIYHYKDELIEFWKKSAKKLNPTKYNWKIVILILIGMVLLNCLSIFPKYIYLLFTDPTSIWETFKFDLVDSYKRFEIIYLRYLG